MKSQDLTTEEKIKTVARDLFHQKGYDGTKTRDIAEAAGINIALMNYYFRSKKKLFDLIMLETIETFFQSVFEILSDEESDLDEKINKLTSHYIDMLKDEPDMPIFILSEIRNDPRSFLDKVFQGKSIRQAPFFQELFQMIQKNNDIPTHPIHLILNLISMVVFPFAARPVIKELFGLEEREFQDLMEERKEMIPVWADRLNDSGRTDKTEIP